jgi:hypothetical protein
MMATNILHELIKIAISQLVELVSNWRSSKVRYYSKPSLIDSIYKKVIKLGGKH